MNATASIQSIVRARMKKLGISVTELGIRMGVDRTTVCAYLRPGASLTLRTAQRIASALECELKILLRPLKGGKAD